MISYLFYIILHYIVLYYIKLCCKLNYIILFYIYSRAIYTAKAYIHIYYIVDTWLRKFQQLQVLVDAQST